MKEDRLPIHDLKAREDLEGFFGEANLDVVLLTLPTFRRLRPLGDLRAHSGFGSAHCRLIAIFH